MYSPHGLVGPQSHCSTHSPLRGMAVLQFFNARLSLEGWVSMLFELAIEFRLVLLSYLSGSGTTVHTVGRV